MGTKTMNATNYFGDTANVDNIVEVLASIKKTNDHFAKFNPNVVSVYGNDDFDCE